MNIADRALAAHEADEEAKRLRKEAEFVQRKARAIDIIGRSAESFGIPIDTDQLVAEYPTNEGRKWVLVVPVDDDMYLRFEWKLDYSNDEQLTVTPRVADQIYWNLPPDETKKKPGGGTYGSNGLEKIHEQEIKTLADLGAAITRVRNARELWASKWEV